MVTIKLMLPNMIIKDKEFFLKGNISVGEGLMCVFFTEQVKNIRPTDPDIVYGILTDNPKQKFKNHVPNLIMFEQLSNGYPKVLQFQLRHEAVTLDNSIIVFYDQESFNKSEALDIKTWDNITMHETASRKYIQPEKLNKDSTKNRWLTVSMFFQHLINYFNLVKWSITSSKRGQLISVQHGNLLLAFLMDLFIGYLILRYLTPDKETVSAALMGTLERLLDSMYSLLKWLMGAPAGLKLNNAFNKMLGRYFSYHVQLWWLFIDISGDKLDMILSAYYYISYLGVTFQAALISDLICIVTFHSYCIYVYAARLFNMQISGLIALLRLFVGRKYNPLRKAIDSCEYTNQELFVGTVAFTILLLLLPTTAMYYSVFTVFRMMSLMVQYALAKVIYWIQTLPLYVIILKVFNSPKVAGNIHIEVLFCEDNEPLVLQVKLLTKSLEDLIPKFKPPAKMLNQMEWVGIFTKVITGKPLT